MIELTPDQGSGFKTYPMGPFGSQDPFQTGPEDPADAIEGTEKTIHICQGDNIIVKPWCDPQMATITEASIQVTNVMNVTIRFLDQFSNILNEAFIQVIFYFNTRPVLCVTMYVGHCTDFSKVECVGIIVHNTFNFF